jgi:ABC-type dipeptide/oligopeptide/nickel transport system permease subunit
LFGSGECAYRIGLNDNVMSYFTAKMYEQPFSFLTMEALAYIKYITSLSSTILAFILSKSPWPVES